MFHLFRGIFFVLLVSIFQPSCTGKEIGFSFLPEKLIKDAVHAYMLQHDVPGVAVGLYYKGKEYFYNFGFADRAHKEKISQNTIFEIGSITKSFIATLLALEINKGSMRLNDPLGKFLAFSDSQSSPFSRITLKQLATHTSGLPRKPGMKKSQVTKKRVLAAFKSWKPLISSKPLYRYSNVGYNLLGYALEAVSGSSYKQMIARAITSPLNMSSTHVREDRSRSGYAQGQSKKGVPVAPVNAGIGAAGALSSTTQDLMQFIKANLGISGPQPLLDALKLTHQPLYKINEQTSQALSWQRFKQEGIEIVDKNGGVGGFSTWLGIAPQSDCGLVILTTRRNAQVTQLGRSLLVAVSKNVIN